MERRERLLHGIDQSRSACAEIGALAEPVLASGAHFVDWTDTATLRARYAKDPCVNTDEIVEVTAVWGDNSLRAALGCTVDYIIASHVIEHVPNLIGWLDEVAEALSPGGELRLAIPDKRFTFDMLRQETRLSDVLQAHLVKARHPQAQAVLDFHLNAVRIDCDSAWRDEYDPAELAHYNTVEEAVEAALDVLENGTYRDVHCWVFTPHSFASLCLRLVQAGLLRMECVGFHGTPRDRLEFYVTMRPCDDAARAAETWRSMAEATRHDVPSRLERRLASAGLYLRP